MKFWDEKRDATLKKLVDQRMLWVEIGERLGIYPSSATARAKKLGFVNHAYKKSPKTGRTVKTVVLQSRH